MNATEYARRAHDVTPALYSELYALLARVRADIEAEARSALDSDSQLAVGRAKERVCSVALILRMALESVESARLALVDRSLLLFAESPSYRAT
jgi:hypothetical protein